MNAERHADELALKAAYLRARAYWTLFKIKQRELGSKHGD
jgi:hypothetical protein